MSPGVVSAMAMRARQSPSVAALQERLESKVSSGSSIELSLLQADGSYHLLFVGQLLALDVGWVASSVATSPLTFYTFQVIELADDGSGAPMGRFEISWLTDPEPPHVVEASPSSSSVTWATAQVCGMDMTAFAGSHDGLVYQLEVAEGRAWKASRVARFPGASSHPTDYKVMLQLRGGAQGAQGRTSEVKVTDLRPATWYHFRLRVSYAYGGAEVLSETVALATKCHSPDAPPRPKALEEKARSVDSRTEWQLKLTWPKPCSNGYPIQQYCLQQCERLLVGGGAAGSSGAASSGGGSGGGRDAATVTASLTNGTDGGSAGGERWTAWHDVYTNLMPEAHLRPPLQVRGAAVGELRFRVCAINSLGASAWSDALVCSPDKFSCFFHKSVAAGASPSAGPAAGGSTVSSKPPAALAGESTLSTVAVGTAVGVRHEPSSGLPSHPLAPLPKARPAVVRGVSLPSASQLEVEAESIRAQLDFPVALGVVMHFLEESRSLSRPLSPYVDAVNAFGVLGLRGVEPPATTGGTPGSLPTPLAPHNLLVPITEPKLSPIR